MDETRSLVINGEILIYGLIDLWDGVRAIDVIASLAELSAERELTVRINSPGGLVYEGLAIHSALRASGKRVNVKVDAIAGSIASVIAMAGDEIVMAEGASIFIHNPADIAVGEAEDLRKVAEELDTMKATIVTIYQKRTGLPEAEIVALMDAQTTMTAELAVEKGFADRVDEPMRMAACKELPKMPPSRLLAAPSTIRAQRPIPAASAAQPERGQQMSQNTAQAAAGTEAAATTPLPGLMSSTALTAPAPEARNEAHPDLNAIRAEAMRIERERVTGIYAFARTARADMSFADELVRNNVSLADAQNRIINKWSEVQANAETGGAGAAPEPRNHVRVEADGQDRWAEGAKKGLMARLNMKGGERNEFTGLSLPELARSSLNAMNIKNGHLDKMSMVGMAFTARNAHPGYHSTSDFGSVLSGVAYRAMMTGYEEVDETFPLWTGKGTASDFRPISRVDMGLFPALDKVIEGAEYTYATIADTGAVVQVATYGKMFAITRQAIVNDDLGFFDRVPRRMGRAAKRTIGNLVYAILNGNPLMQDGVALFHATHGNVAGAGAVPSVATIGSLAALMAVQKDEAGLSTGLGIVPKFILVPPALLMTTNSAVTSATIPGDAGQVANPIRGTVTPIQDGRLSGTAWFLAADPAQADTIEVTYLDGVEEPFLDQREGWNVDGSEFKVRMDAGVKALHWRGLARNAGA